jgi:transcriptional regulator with XRE-family HTH domain
MASRKIHPMTEALAYNIRLLRVKRGMSQIVLAVEAGTTPATISAIENREGNPTLEILQRLADALGGEVAALFAKPE